MSEFWSNHIQGAKALDYDRRRRIREEHKDLYLKYLGLERGTTIIDVGCGPGSLSRKIASWLDYNSKVIGVEMDKNFIKYAIKMAEREGLRNIEYMEGDALNLPFEDNSVDSCYSSEVIQFLNPDKFLTEQKRICKPGASVAVMNTIPTARYHSHKSLVPEKSKREMDLWEMVLKPGEEKFEELDLLKHKMEPKDYPRLFQKLGFRNIEVNALNMFYAIDDARNSLDKKIEIMEADRQSDLELIEIGQNCSEKNIPNEIMEELKTLIEARYNERKKKIFCNDYTWDFKISTLLIVKGIK